MVGRRAEPSVAVIIPALNEPLLGPALQHLSMQTADAIIVVRVDDDTITLEALRNMPLPANTHLVSAPLGRALQMNHGTAAATADILLFLHADTELPPHALADVRRAIAAGALWGFFAVRIAGRHPLLRIVESMMNWRSRLTGIATGDQAIFVRRDVFRLLGGYARIELMEDIELCARLKWLARPTRVPRTVITSARRWEARGVVRTIVLMWWLRALFALGVSPRRLARWYR